MNHLANIRARDKVVLLVEDQPDDEILTLRALRKGQMTNPIVVARDGQEALDFVFCRGIFGERAGQPNPALIILDLKLPKVDGLGVLRAIREDVHTRLTPVVVLTSSNQEQDLTQAYALGVNSYIRKPVDFAAFQEAARLLGVYWLTLNCGLPD